LELFSNNTSTANAVSGIFMAAIVGLVVFGGIRRIAQVASRLVPFMVTIYLLAAIMILSSHISEIPSLIRLIIHDAFTGEAVLGGAVGAVIATGIRRAAFSNEAGMGTEAMAHGAAKTKEPVREGLVAMLGPLIDTIIVCSITALVILTSGMWQAGFQSAEKVTIPAGSESVNLRIDDIKELSLPNKKWVGLEFTISKELYDSTVKNDTIEIISVIDKETLICKNIGRKDIDVVKDSWFRLEENGVTLTTLAFDKELGVAGKILIIIAVLTFSLSTMFGYSYYGRKCAGYLLGVRWKSAYNWVYILAIVVASMVKIDLAINFVDSMFALMAIPTVISTLILAPKVMQAARKYFRQLES
jgi:AGCS family alanine or glycine:cation symporter